VTVEIVNISEAKAQLSRLVNDVRQGRSVLIGKAGRPVAKLVPYDGVEAERRPGALKGRIRIAEDFDELPEDIAAALGMVDEP